jgi:hypothetical protein
LLQPFQGVHHFGAAGAAPSVGIPGPTDRGRPEAAPAARATCGLDVERQVELVRVRAEAQFVHLVLPLVIDPGVDDVLGEDPAL